MCGTAAAVGLSSGTAGLHLALHANRIGPGDDVLVATFTFAAAANAVVYTGARPVFVDAEASSCCIDVDLLEQALTDGASTGRQVKALIAVDLYGQGPDYDRLVPLCRDHGVLVIEDAAEAIGSHFGSAPAGSLGDIGVLSFNGNKLITTSGGGAVVVDDPTLAERIRFLASQARQPVAHYEHEEVGFNDRLSNVLAALGRAQLATLPDRIADRRATRAWYAERLARIDGDELNPIPPGQASNCWLTCVTVDPAVAPFTAADLIGQLSTDGIESRPVWKPIHRQPVFADAPRLGGAVADGLFEVGVTLPSAGHQDGFYRRIGDSLDRLIDRRGA